jgi:hypothetical protein
MTDELKIIKLDKEEKTFLGNTFAESIATVISEDILFQKEKRISANNLEIYLNNIVLNRVTEIKLDICATTRNCIIELKIISEKLEEEFKEDFKKRFNLKSKFVIISKETLEKFFNYEISISFCDLNLIICSKTSELPILEFKESI